MSTANPPDAEMTSPPIVEPIGPHVPDARVASPLDHPYHLTAERYSEMIALGAFRKRDHLYLWKGRLVAKITKGRPHVIAQSKLTNRMVPLVPIGWHVEQDQPIALGDDTMPEPDLTIIRGTANDYSTAPPSARDIALVVEVSDSSLAEDLGDVLQIYAAEGIPIYWVVGLAARVILVHGDPTGPAERPGYRTCQEYREGEEIPVVIDGREVGRIAVSDILPSA
ncbi:MAG: Uma2 family endonuclease [Isosphaeraceae bacterium]|nr:Uma2 family endonuclease [Isosphaeraceae bacterium]